MGDPSSAGLDVYSTLIGSPENMGDAAYGAPTYGDVNNIGLAEVGELAPWMKYAGVGLAGAGAGALTTSLINQAKIRELRSQNVQAALAAAANRNTITNSVLARRMMGRIPGNTPFQFYSLEGGNLNQYPLAPTEYFPAEMLKYNLNRQNQETPFEVEIAPGAVVGPNIVATATGTVGARFFGAIVVTIGINALAANPGTVTTVTATIPTLAGPLSIVANPFSFTIGKDYYIKFIIYPWQLITNKPVLVLGSYSNANPITVTVAGVPLSSSVTLVVPGSMHQWTIAMRNRLAAH
jgi:hypothetical protein